MKLPNGCEVTAQGCLGMRQRPLVYADVIATAVSVAGGVQEALNSTIVVRIENISLWLSDLRVGDKYVVHGIDRNLGIVRLSLEYSDETT